MSNMSDYLEENSLLWFFRNTSFSRPATFYAALLTALAGDTPTEVAVGGYARQAINTGASSQFAAPGSSGDGYLTDNAIVLEFGPLSSGATIVAAALYDALSSGNCWYLGWLSTQKWVFTGKASDDIVTAFGHAFSNDDRAVVRAVPDSTLPTGLTADTLYYVVGVSGGTLQLSTTSGGAAINITADGAGEILKVVPKTVNAGDYFRFPIGAFDILHR